MFTSIIVILICYYSKETLEIVKNSLELISSTYDITVINIILFLAIMLFLETITLVLIGYTGIITGHRFNYGKTTKSVLFSILLYFLVQTLTLLIIFIIGFINPDIMVLFTSTEMTSIDSIKMVMLMCAIIYLCYIIIIEVVNRKLFCKGVNID